MLPTGRHACRYGRTTHGTAVSYSTWHTPIVCAGVVVLFHWGCWSSLTCPRTYLPPRHDQSRIPSLRRVVLHAFSGTMNPSDSLPAPCDFNLPALYPRALSDLTAG